MNQFYPDSLQSSVDASIGSVLAGKYRVDRILGRGGMGVVVAATHLELDTPVALKFLLPEVRSSSEVVARFAREARAAALKSRLVSITIIVPDANRVAGLEVRRDGAGVGIATWGTSVPADPGSHTIVASAPGYRSWQTTVTVVDGVQPVRVTVPRLETATASAAIQPVAPPANSPPANPNSTAATTTIAPVAETAAPPAPAVPPPDSKSSGSTQRTLAYVVGGAGIVGIGVGTVFGLNANSKNKDSLPLCRTPNTCSQSGYDLRQQALDAATYSNVAFAIGLAALTAGVVLLVTAPSTEKIPTQPQAHWTVDAGFTTSNGHLSVKGAF